MTTTTRTLLYLHEADVEHILAGDPHLTGIVDTFEAAFAAYARGEVITPANERTRLVYPPGSTVRPYERDMRILPAMLPSMGSAGLRVGCTSKAVGSPANVGSTSYTLLLDFATMGTLAIVEDHYLHGVRSGVPTGIAVRHLANPGADTVGVIGCGRISRVQLAVALGQSGATTVRVFSRDPARRAAFAAEAAATFGVDAAACDSANEVARCADILVCATNSYHEPVFDGSVLRPGTLVASVTPGETDQLTPLRGTTVLSSSNRVATDYTAQEPVASLVADGRLDLAALPTLGEVVCGTATGRHGPADVVFFFSPGIGFLDLAAARYVYDRAVTTGIGTTIG
jgi:ornithine cyclodeaminase/alanine dehydrogenase-like protein (mu-crystallin family)